MTFAHLLPSLENLSSKVLSLGMVKEMTWTIWCIEEDMSSVQRQADSLWDEYSEESTRSMIVDRGFNEAQSGL